MTARVDDDGARPSEAGAQRDDAARAAGLPARAARQLRRALQWLDRGEIAHAERAAADALALAPGHPEAMRVHALTLHRDGRYGEAIALLRSALEQRPRDELIHNNLGSALAESGDFEQAVVAFRAACACAPELAAAWFNLANALDALHRYDEALDASAHALRAEPQHRTARLLHANLLAAGGRIDDAVATFREGLRHEPAAAEVWAGLLGLKAYLPDAADLDALRRLCADTRPAVPRRALAHFAYGMALEANGRLTDAFDAFMTAAALKRSLVRWDADAMSRIVDGLIDAFSGPIAAASDPELGREAILICGLPRSGSTLTEQILAAHPDVDGAGERPVLIDVLRDEGRRRGVDLARWVGAASADDWARLGREYLDRMRPSRGVRPRFTDKMLVNWQVVGAARAMLPGARIVECRRDPLETCWSCFKHHFANEQNFSYDLGEMAAYWRDYDRLMRFWHERDPDVIFTQELEALTTDPEPRIRALLEFCALDFDPACLRPHEAERHVRTASAAQVRMPLRGAAATAARYGALLDPLRRALETGRGLAAGAPI
ncbi:MAG TPA: sulfotransferase [Dokdonella sp.]